MIGEAYTPLVPALKEAEEGRSMNLRSAWSTEYQDIEGYPEKPYLKKQKQKALTQMWLYVFKSKAWRQGQDSQEQAMRPCLKRK